MPRFKKVTLKELIESLNKAIATENRRIKKVIIHKNALREAGVALPKRKIGVKIQNIYKNLQNYFRKNHSKNKISYSEFVGSNKEEKVISFSPLLQLEHQKKVWLDQDAHFEEIYIWLKNIYLKHNPEPFADLKRDVEKELEELDDEKKKRLEEIDKNFENPLGEMVG